MKTIQAIILSFMLSFQVHGGDIITLNNEKVFEGKVVRIKNCTVVFKAEGERFDIPASDIFSIAFADTHDKIYRDYLKQSERDPDACLKGYSDAKGYHGKKETHFMLGFLFGPYAMIATALSNPTPQKGVSTMANSTNKELFNDPDYLRCYRKKAKGQLIGMEALGLGTMLVSFGALLFFAWGGGRY